MKKLSIVLLIAAAVMAGLSGFGIYRAVIRYDSLLTDSPLKYHLMPWFILLLIAGISAISAVCISKKTGGK